MVFKTKYRQIIHYSLIVSTLLIQVMILLFFYNEYFNGKKLARIEEQQQVTAILNNLTKDSRIKLLNAQEQLQKYIRSNDQDNLESYFLSLRQLNRNIDSIKSYANQHPGLKSSMNTRRDEIARLTGLQTLIDSTYRQSRKPAQKEEPVQIKSFDIKSEPRNLEIEVYHSSDTLVKKGLIPRLKDAIQGNVEVKRDTTFITAKYENSVDTSQIKTDLDSTISAVNQHYQKEIQKYQTHLSSSRTKSQNLYHIYDNLIVFSNNLMEIYDGTITDFTQKLQEQYAEQNSKNNKIRRNTVLGLLILMFFVLMVIMYYTKMAFLYEKKLKLANEKINSNLYFKSRILGMLSHEIRSPLQIINIFINRINKKTDDETVKDYLKSMKFTNDSLLIQAQQILDYTKNQNTSMELYAVDFNLKDEIDSILRMFQPYVESRNNAFVVDNRIPEGLNVHADAAKIHQIFVNILGNASKFTENGTVSVHTETQIRSEKNVRLTVAVSDTGIGISKSDIQKIFQPYYQGMISDEISNFGIGLGLNLCKEIIQLFKGTISVKSELGTGTTVYFDLNLTLLP